MKLFNRKSNEKVEERKLEDIHFSFSNSFFRSSSVHSIALQCTNLISNTIATMPVNLYFKKNDGSRIKAYNNPYYSILKSNPNIDEAPFTFYSRIITFLLEDGNAYLFIDNEKAFYVLDSRLMKVERDELNRKRFIYNGKEMNRKNILHIPGLRYNGLKGVGVLKFGEETIDLANEMDSFAKESFNSGITKRPIFDISEMYPNAKPDDVLRMGEYIRKNYSDNSKPFITFNKMAVKSFDSQDNRTNQLLENREFQIKLVSSLFNVPYNLLTGTQTNVDLEVQNTSFLTYTLLPWITILEQYLIKALSPYEQERYFIKFNTSGLLKADMLKRMQSYQIGVSNGVLNHNDIMKLEDKQTTEDDWGNAYFVPANLMPLRNETIESYMAKAQETMDKMKNHSPLGDDKA